MGIKIQKKEGKKWVDDQDVFTVSPELTKACEDTNDINALVSAYVICRDAKEHIKRLQTEWTSPINSLMDVIEAKFLQKLDESNSENIKTASGTVYKTIKTSAKVADWNVVIEYIKKYEAYDMLTKKLVDTAVKARLEETGEIVPGVDLVRFVDIGVRRA